MGTRKLLLGAVALTLIAPTLGGCDLARNQLKPDRSGNLEMQDYRDALAERQPELDVSGFESGASGAPEFKPYVANNLEQVKPMPLVSISVNQTVPLRDVLFELADQADYDLELDPNIRGSIIYTARERPFDMVIDRISDIAGLRYKFEDDVLRVELDQPYNKTYKIDYLNYVRANKSAISNNISVVSGSEADTGSNFKTEASSESDFWGELEANLGQILGNAQNRSMRTLRDPRVTAAAQNPDVVPVAPTQGENGVQVSAPDVVLNVDSLPVDEMDDPQMSGGSNRQEGNGFSFAVNRQAGLVTIFGNQKAHKEISEYLTELKRSTTAQVLIEAKIIEVQLFDQFSAGVDWQALSLLSGEGVLQFGSAAGVDSGISTLGTRVPPLGTNALEGILANNTATRPSNSLGDGNFVVGFLGNDVQAMVQALQSFGTTKALASPRLTVLNNQSAVLNVATNVVYFEIEVDVQSATRDQPRSVEVDSDIKNVPEGVLVNVQPSIDLENQTITMALRPTITRVTQRVPDPGVAVVAEEAGIALDNGIPELSVQEIDSVIQLRSGQPIVMGGLLEDRAVTTEGAVPVLGEMPLFGAAFRNQQDQIMKTELVILLKATIIDPTETIHNTDKDLYRQFSGDRRPFNL